MSISKQNVRVRFRAETSSVSALGAVAEWQQMRRTEKIPLGACDPIPVSQRPFWRHKSLPVVQAVTAEPFLHVCSMPIAIASKASRQVQTNRSPIRTWSGGDPKLAAIGPQVRRPSLRFAARQLCAHNFLAHILAHAVLVPPASQRLVRYLRGKFYLRSGRSVART